MLRTTFFALAAMGLAVASQAATIVTQSSAPTVGMAGHTTWTLTAVSDQGPIAGFDFTGGDNGFFGPMNQVNPAANATVFTDANGFFAFVGADVSQDSQFKFASNSGTVVGAEEGPNTLQAAISFGTANAKVGPLAFVQLAIPGAAAATVDFRGNFTVLAAGGPILEDVAGRVGGDGPIIPEPSTIALAGLALLGFIGYNRRK